jgi:hypothetical protein
MNMDMNLVNRALLNIGNFPLSDTDRADNNTTFVLAKHFYLETFLEALSEAEWTGARKRARLVLTGRPIVKNDEYCFAYDMPYDCAKPIELQNNEYFEVEDRIIYTHVKKAELLYVSNGKVLRRIKSIRPPRDGEIPDMEYFTCGGAGDLPGVTLCAGGAADLPKAIPQGAVEVMPLEDVVTDDYPDYAALQFEPKFYQYIENMLSAKFAMKLSSDPNLSNNLLQKAMLIKDEAYRTSMSNKAAKENGDAWWGDELGMSSGGPEYDHRGNMVRGERW